MLPSRPSGPRSCASCWRWVGSSCAAGSSDTPGYLPGYGAIPAATVQELATHAALRPLPSPQDLVAEPQYRPPAGPARFIGCRDLTCRWPGCDQPAYGMRYRPQRALSTPADPPAEQPVVLPNSSPVQDVSRRACRIDPDTAARRHPHLDLTTARAPTPPHPPAPCSFPNSGSPPRSW